MQLQALIRASVGRPLHVMFPFVADIGEYEAAYKILMQELSREQRVGLGQWEGHALDDPLGRRQPPARRTRAPAR